MNAIILCCAGILRQNYRSHASLLSIPNRLFYGDQLQAAADQQLLRPPQLEALKPAVPEHGAVNGVIIEGMQFCISVGVTLGHAIRFQQILNVIAFLKGRAL